MKKLLLLFICVLSIQSLHGQKAVNSFIDEMKKNKDSYVVTLPGWLLRTGVNMVDDNDKMYEPGIQEIVDGIKKLRVLFLEGNSKLSSSDIRSVVNKIKEKDGYVDYATVKDGGTNVHVIVKEDKTKVKSLVLLANTEDGFTIINLKTDIDMEELENANLSFNKNKEFHNHDHSHDHNHNH